MCIRDRFFKVRCNIAPPLKPNEECWYLPIFGVYHPLKPEKVRMVFDSSARFQDLSLNSVLLSGPDLTNSLIGVLMRFRMETVAVVADIEQMFYCFGVAEKHRNFLRFLWYADNDPTKPVIEYRMTVQVFGNTPSPVVATYGLRLVVKAVKAVKGERPLPKSSSILRLNPMLDEEGIIRVGGGLQRSDFDLRERNPSLVPGNHHIAKPLVLHFHKMTHHQGRHITEGAIRSAGFWITGAKRLVSSVI